MHGTSAARLTRAQSAVAVAALCLLVVLALGLAPARARGASITRLSDLHGVSHWAYPSTQAPVHSAPSAHAHTIGQLRFLTSDEQAQLYVELASEQVSAGQTWIEIEYPGRPNGRRGWVLSSGLGAAHSVDGYLHIDRTTLRATLYRGGRAIFDAPVGVGKASTVTPAGHFYVVEKLRTSNSPVYGPVALGTSAYAPSLSEWPGGGVVGIHGTDQPQLIPGRPSHGCIRLRDGDIVRLWKTIELGTPIEIT